jgi:hypothetical protein
VLNPPMQAVHPNIACGLIEYGILLPYCRLASHTSCDRQAENIPVSTFSFKASITA